ncbi:uncharacterized protein PITG_16750 [Phytophthora infestans T30-4]|uniref:Uncharacterized protein n=1 Tax=Phytophthora infestans (strain T30-4) TaxID=403677 RepID=D0NVJ1_PHYIT|nr:uncharacterized protein PITG_16750 [Phytophthora infestans T30-4]EEY66668.1 conserved hypothetical protein [Phytophthora infestans T30-4]|eukprot:XP_002896969.1 conserved hypothetical protein [Phytophthora infestans T30-4]
MATTEDAAFAQGIRSDRATDPVSVAGRQLFDRVKSRENASPEDEVKNIIRILASFAQYLHFHPNNVKLENILFEMLDNGGQLKLAIMGTFSCSITITVGLKSTPGWVFLAQTFTARESRPWKQRRRRRWWHPVSQPTRRNERNAEIEYEIEKLYAKRWINDSTFYLVQWIQDLILWHRSIGIQVLQSTHPLPPSPSYKMKMSITAIVVHLSIWCRSCQPTIVPVVDDGTSDEFNVANRSFRAGDDHIWTPLEKPDGVNGALELYSHNMTPTKCDDDGTCCFFIKTVDEVNSSHVYNMYTHLPSFTDVNFFYRAYYGKERGHKSWYQGLRYAANNYCKQNAEEKQDYATFAASVKAGITENTCAVDTCPASGDVNAELSLIVGKGKDHWGINSNGTCYPLINSYMGSYLCDPDNMFSSVPVLAMSPTTPQSNAISAFNYQNECNLRRNWPIFRRVTRVSRTTKVEWGYRARMDSWCATPPNPGKECRGDGKDPVTNVICDSFPMYMKIDHIRLYQDLATDLEADNYMQVGCDPASHPTQEWIEAHIDEYEDNDNKWEEVAGKAFCETSDDCTIGGTLSRTALKTGKLFK